jgi:ribosome-binding factor A
MNTDLPSGRHERVASLIKEKAAEFIQREANHSPLITVTRIGIAPDYRRVTIFITTIPEGGEHNALIFLKRYAGEFRQYLKKKTNLKIIPHIEFDLDVGERHRQHTDEIFNKIQEEDKE